jgi:hypothetical protein
LHTGLINLWFTKVKKLTEGRRSTKKMSNYSESETAYMVELYKNSPTPDTVEILVEELNKSKKSIIGKLSREGVYRREIYVTKTGEKPVTKMEIVDNIAESLGIETTNLTGLEKSPKATLKTLETAVAGLTQTSTYDSYPGGL